MIVQVAVNLPQVKGLFDYHLPAELEGQVAPGSLVVVPFGQQMVQGIVLRLAEQAAVPMTKPVASLVDDEPVLTAVQLRLAERLTELTLAPLVNCLDLMLPPGLSQVADTQYALNPNPPQPAGSLSPLQERILALLERRGALRGRQIEAALPRQPRWREAAQFLARKGWVLARPVLPPPTVRPKVVRTVQLALPPETALQRVEALGRGGAVIRRRKIVEFLIREPLPVNVSWAYAVSGGNLSDLNRLALEGLVILGETEVWRDPLAEVQAQPYAAPILTADQQRAFTAIAAGVQAAAAGKAVRPFLLHGVTGSGKTEIYLRAVEQALALGRSAIVLVPEIALTPQTARRFLGRFPGQVGLVHSQLSSGERYDTWRRARAGLLPVVVGPRSALFTPLPELGLIVVDECHEQSYYQDAFYPRYSAIEAALEYARLANAAVILGSATPDLNLQFRAGEENWQVLRLPQRILAHRQAVQAQMESLGRPLPSLDGDATAASLPLPPVEVVDMRAELKAGNRSIFSRSLRNELTRVLDAHQQAILYLNRRGTATYVFCRDCGYVLRCPHCELPLTYHTDENRLICHTCNHRRQMPASCPACKSANIRQFGTGTEKVEAEVQALFPQATVLRWDAETTRQKGSHEIILAHFINHRADILVGTQMLAKGLDLPLVTLVGVVLADVGLNLPDFRAGERVFQLLTQVAGRAGRSALGGRVILQTFQPDHYAILHAARHDAEGFYQTELAHRRKLGYPPFSHLARLEYRHLRADAAEAAARQMAELVQHWIEQGGYGETEIIGPAPCFFNRVAGEYRWQILLRGPNPRAVLRGRDLGEWLVDFDPPAVL